ncbi:MAG: class I SAM-dependent methyltransferase [Candidatus Woesearchaeota archaeon]
MKMAKGNKEMYDKIKPGYYHEAMLHGKPIQRFWHKAKFTTVIKLMKPNKKILDIACGPGSLFFLMKKPMKLMVGTDLALPQLFYAKKVFPKANYIASDVFHLPFKEESFNYVIMLELIEHLPKNDLIFREVKKVLKKGGKLIVSTPNYMSLWPIIEKIWDIFSPIKYSKQHINFYTQKRLALELSKAGYKSIRINTKFVISPFVAVFSPRIAFKIFEIESRIFPRVGQIIFVEAEK